MLVARPRRDHQRGNSLLLALIVLSSLATLGSLTVVSVQSTLKASTNDRSQAVAMYAAESGGAAAMLFLRNNFDANVGWTAFIDTAAPASPRPLTELLSSGAAPGTPNNVFSLDQNASFTVAILNNLSDPNYGAGRDRDGIVIIRSTGNGPQGSVAIIEWEVERIAPQPILPPPAPLPAAQPVPPAPPLGPWLTPPDVPPAVTSPLLIRSWRVVL